MHEITVTVDSLPHWAKQYFAEFRKWYAASAPKPLPQDRKSYIELYSENIGIWYDISSNPNEEHTKIESFTFKWNNEQDYLLFILKH